MATVLAEKPVEKATASNGEAAPQEYHWTVDALYRAVDAGVFPEPSRIELIHGRVIDRMGQGSLHLWCRIRIGRRMRAALEPRFLLVEECSVRIAFDGEPVADVAVLQEAVNSDDEHTPTPEDVVLLVEVAVSSADYDLGEKALLYAQAGIADYWVVLPEQKQIVVHREPSADGYKSVMFFGEDEGVSPLAAPEVVLQVRELLGH